MSFALADFRANQKMQGAALGRFETLTNEQLSALAVAQAQMLAEQAELIAQLARRPVPVELGETSIVVGALLSVTTAGSKREVKPFAGVRPTDLLRATPLIYLPDGYGLPQVTCRNAGQLEIRISVPNIALGTQVTVGLAITAIRSTL